MTISNEAVVRNQRLSSLKREIGILEHREQLTTARSERLAEAREELKRLEIAQVRAVLDDDPRVREALDNGYVDRGGDYGDRPPDTYSARRHDPKHMPVLGPNDSFVDYLKDTGEVVYDQEYRLAMLGALGSGNQRQLTRLSKYAKGDTRDMLISSGGNAVLTLTWCPRS
jgi:hypothetical protein